MPESKEKKNPDRAYWLFALRIMSDFGVTIAVPVLGFVALGKWLDQRLDTSPLIIILAFALAFLISAVSIYRKASKYAQEYKELEK